ncbi:MFS transporter [Kitasatospora sp. NPDC001261]|uniref:MFS transporter n=1 Tax=Kitasatospora sp. NPDC001261 TaxID=3364012 RepID=UPI00369A00F3
MTVPTATPSAPARALPGPVPLRRNADFIRLWVSAGISRFGTSVTMVAYPLLALWHTGSASTTGLVTFAAALPNLFVQLPAGALVDRWNRRRLMVGCDIVCVTVVASIAVTELCGRFWLPQLMLGAFLQSAMTILYQLSERAAVRTVVEPGQLSAALAQNEARGAAIGLLAQPGSSLLFTVARWLPFAANAAVGLVAAVLLVTLRRALGPAQADRAVPPGGTSLRAAVGEGVRWLWRQRFLRVMTCVFAGSNLVFQVLLLAVLVRIHNGGHPPAVVGLVLGAGGLGGILGALSAGWWSRRSDLYRTAVAGFAVWTVFIPVSACSGSPALIAASLAGITFVASLFNVTGNVYQMQVTPEALQGRVNGASSFLSSGANSLGALAGGWLVDRAGPSATGFVLGVAVLALTAVVAFSPAVRAEHRASAAPDGPAPASATPDGGTQEPPAAAESAGMGGI